MDDSSKAREGAAGPQTREPLDITVLMGGPSSEREVSLLSGRAIAGGLERRGHRVTCDDISPRDAAALDRAGIDLVFIALHGYFGESGEVQRLCEQRGLRYTGSGPRASELAMNKAAAKQILKRRGLATPDWMILETYHTPQQVERWLREIDLPVVVKPVDSGSSVDVVIARTAAGRDAAISELIDKYGRVMVERFVAGRELTVGILGDEALPVLEVVPAHEFYDYEAKYADGAGTRYVFDHGLDAETCRRVREAAMEAHRCLECRDFSRVDFILDDAGEPQCLEINTIPGFTGHSLLPMAAERVGLSFDALVDRIAALAIERQPATAR